MQRIKLMTDSACDLPGSLARQLGIEVIPIPIAVDGKGYLEGIDFTPREFYTILQQAKQIPTTSQISPVTYCERYHDAVHDCSGNVDYCHRWKDEHVHHHRGHPNRHSDPQCRWHWQHVSVDRPPINLPY